MAKNLEEKTEEVNKSSNFKNNRSRRRSNNRSRSTKEDKTYKGQRGNDLSWHAKSETLLTAAGSIPWSWATGRPLPLTSSMRGESNSSYTLPGIHAIRTVLMPGVGSKHTDAINIACQALYTDIRRELKSANAYEGSDVMIYMLAVADIIAMTSWMTRLYATTMLYSFQNNFVPDALIRAQNVNPDDLHNRATEFRSRINQAIAKASQIWIPKGFDFISRARWLYSGYYTEGESMKDQIYMYTPGCFRRFTTFADSDYAGGLEVFVPIPGYTDDVHAFSVDSLCTYFNQMIDALVGDSDFQNIAGDLFNRYGANGVETFTLIPEDAITYPVFSEEVLEQMMNSRCLAAYKFAFDNIEDEAYLKYFTVNQDETNNVIVIPNKLSVDISSLNDAAKANFIGNLTADAHSPLLTTHKDPSPSKTMLISRDTNVVLLAEDKGNNKYDVTVDVASEVVVDYEVITRDVNGNLRTIKYASGLKGLGSYPLYILSAFHYAPIAYIADATFGLMHFGNLDICAPITAEQLQDLNRVDLMSLFAVPDVGKVNK